MKIIFYLKLALVNIKKNMKFYLPYLCTAIFTVMMFYLFKFLVNNKGIDAMGQTTAAGLRSIFGFGSFVIAIFSMIFLFYTNSFVLKRRKKELGLFNVLGMEKRHLSVLMFIENTIISTVAIVSGVLIGILFSKLMLLFLYKLIKIQAAFGFEISLSSIFYTVTLFMCIFGVNLIYDLIQIACTKPVNLLSGSNVGEREPKTKWILTVLGAGSMVAGYILANTITSPLEALSVFFIAVLLVIFGTYMLFIAVSITILKLLKKNKNFYYRADRFVSVSGMLYRMKQNAAGLASICILSTMVIIMVSTTVCMYVGAEDLIKNRFPHELTIDVQDPENRELEAVEKECIKAVESTGEKVTHHAITTQMILLIDGSKAGIQPLFDGGGSQINATMASVISLDTYRLYNPEFEGELEDNQIYLYVPKKKGYHDSLQIMGNSFDVRGKIRKSDFNKENYFLNIYDMYIVVVKNDETVNAIRDEYQQLLDKRVEELGENAVSPYNSPQVYGSICLDVTGTIEKKIDIYQIIVDILSREIQIVQRDGTVNSKIAAVSVSSQANSRAGFDADYGGLLFLGIFLGVTFLVATVLIIYYKQITEGYDDCKRFMIMQQVGMSKEEVRRTIKSQVMLVFFLPLITAGCHIMGSFKMIQKLLNLLNLYNVGLFVLFTIITVIGFSLFYIVIYLMTARVYYKIVESGV